MNKEQFKGKWNQVKGSVKNRWGEITDDEVTQVEGDYDRMVGLIQEKYGKTKEEAQKEVDSL